MKIHDLLQKENIQKSNFLPTEELLLKAQEKLNFKMGILLKDYLLNCGFLEFFFVEINGIYANKGLDSDLITKTISLQERFEKTKGFILLEDKGDGDYILCDSNDKVYEFIPSMSFEIKPLNVDIISYLESRYSEVAEI